MTTQHLRTVGDGIDIRIDHDDEEVYIDGVCQQGDFNDHLSYMSKQLERGHLFIPSEGER